MKVWVQSCCNQLLYSRMVWEQCASVIVLLTQKMEHLGGLNPKFWPEKGITNHYGLVQSGNWMTGSLSIRTTKEVKDRQIKDLVTRHIELRSEHPVTFSEVELYHYLGWPHHGTCQPRLLLVSHGRTPFRLEGKVLGHGHRAVCHPTLCSVYQSQ